MTFELNNNCKLKMFWALLNQCGL